MVAVILQAKPISVLNFSRNSLFIPADHYGESLVTDENAFQTTLQ